MMLSEWKDNKYKVMHYDELSEIVKLTCDNHNIEINDFIKNKLRDSICKTPISSKCDIDKYNTDMRRIKNGETIEEKSIDISKLTKKQIDEYLIQAINIKVNVNHSYTTLSNGRIINEIKSHIFTKHKDLNLGLIFNYKQIMTKATM